MANFGSLSTTHVMVMVMVAVLCYVSGIAAGQGLDIAPLPGMETGAGFSLLVPRALVWSSVLGSLVALLLCI
ncbi:hypothetical protein SLEP1_g35159 [Rubroshorea leprosula]|uniref:Uncharacterized protein n=1 Tax=Rubroshorea leprosula TaxID=152421 RepID=A0AAV5KMD3_9ROSI|nr:hypothetical protein SLEP1_g35159 [Rubroshorea leprosula]